MHYTIAIIEAIQRAFKIELVKSGKNYVVTASNSDNHASRTFDNIKDAYEAFEQQARYICYGLYADNDRFQILMEGGTSHESDICKE